MTWDGENSLWQNYLESAQCVRARLKSCLTQSTA
jgi:hypothetical protein